MEYKKRICLGPDCNRMVLGDRHTRYCKDCKQNKTNLENAYSFSENNISTRNFNKRWKKAKNPLDKWRML